MLSKERHQTATGPFSEWQKRGHLGDFLRAMSNTFEEAKKSSPSVLFIDEMDSFLEDSDGKNSSYDTKAVKGILEQLDGIRGCEGVGVVAAANNLEKIPAAIRRSGRFDNIVTIPLPDRSDLAVIFKQHPKPAETDIDLQACSVQGLGKTGADCAAAVRKGRAIARRTKRQLTTSDILHSLSGDLCNISKDLRFRMSVHECGHALIGSSYSELTVEFLRISEQGGECRITGQEMIHTAATMHRDRTILLGGRMAEILILGAPSSGSGGDHDSDLAKIAISAANEAGAFGLGQTGAIWLGASNSEALLRDVYNCNLPEVAELIAAAEVEARRRLEPLRSHLTVMAEALMETGVLTGERLTELLAGGGAPEAMG
ncbi:AAA family ATPase [Parasedimentitalea huanghaiensis]|uniref:AAA family ATPase n=1 Tax=Parasedimentitalea huanghaiensis TaxID=2682100 RepID=A0A6L6WIV6_9RHOB|nr:AAA family ATPase [Zongyanglinia huanghaiensis]MVO17644.1 AAA family ATPase [Zongyanglinia huanghaiensis]